MTERPQRIVRPITAFSLSGSSRRKPRRESAAHLKWIRTLPCLVTGRRDRIEAAHIRYSDLRYGKRDVGGQEKPDDRWTVPLHWEEHRRQHEMNEREFWRALGIDPVATAIALWAATGEDDVAEVIIRAMRGRR